MQKLGKRLLLLEADRNTASPTESAVWKRKQREHSGADWLKYSRSVMKHSFSNAGGTADKKIIRPGIRVSIPGLFLYSGLTIISEKE